MENLYLDINNDEQYYTHPIDMDIMKCLISKASYCSLVGGPCSAQGGRDCALVLNFNKDNAIKSYCLITINTITKNSITQLILNHYLMSLCKPSSTEHRYPSYTDSKTVNPPLALRMFHILIKLYILSF